MHITTGVYPVIYIPSVISMISLSFMQLSVVLYFMFAADL